MVTSHDMIIVLFVAKVYHPDLAPACAGSIDGRTSNCRRELEE